MLSQPGNEIRTPIYGHDSHLSPVPRLNLTRLVTSATGEESKKSIKYIQLYSAVQRFASTDSESSEGNAVEVHIFLHKTVAVRAGWLLGIR